MVDAAVEDCAIVDAWKGERQGRLREVHLSYVENARPLVYCSVVVVLMRHPVSLGLSSN